ncbi:MAG: type II toxin-antitoxin system VapC family toxin [Gammaproteobacteria bacterium]|nr:type II toxin-antitoxin system VapC family toxin [Gammaproteobacteria bacterium]
MIVLDTHILIWLTQGNPLLGQQTREIIDNALQNNALSVSAITFWEISLLQRKSRIELPEINNWRRSLLSMELIEIALDGTVCNLSNTLQDFHPDSADRFIVASALQYNATLITSDQRILDWKSSLKRLNSKH